MKEPNSASDGGVTPLDLDQIGLDAETIPPIGYLVAELSVESWPLAISRTKAATFALLFEIRRLRSALAAREDTGQARLRAALEGYRRTNAERYGSNEVGFILNIQQREGAFWDAVNELLKAALLASAPSETPAAVPAAPTREKPLVVQWPLRKLCICGHFHDQHAHPGTLGMRCTECGCWGFHEKVAESGADQPKEQPKP